VRCFFCITNMCCSLCGGAVEGLSAFTVLHFLGLFCLSCKSSGFYSLVLAGFNHVSILDGEHSNISLIFNFFNKNWSSLYARRK